MFGKLLFLMIYFTSFIYCVSVSMPTNTLIPSQGTISIPITIKNTNKSIKAYEVEIKSFYYDEAGKEISNTSLDDFIVDLTKIVVNPKESIVVNLLYINSPPVEKDLFYSFKVIERSLDDLISESLDSTKDDKIITASMKILTAVEKIIIVKSVNSHRKFSSNLKDCSEELTFCDFEFINLSSSSYKLNLLSLNISNKSGSFIVPVDSFKTQRFYPKERIVISLPVSSVPGDIRDFDYEFDYNIW